MYCRVHFVFKYTKVTVIYYLYVLLSLYGLSFVVGYFVSNNKLDVHYGRKILSISFFLIATFIITRDLAPLSLHDILFGIFAPLIWLGSFMRVFRERSSFIRICFSAIDRPEDRPYTLIWLSTGMVVGYIVLLLMVQWLKIYDAGFLITMTVFISVFGDGLAEPVGVRFGRHKYKARALFTKQLYERSYEGSACVALAAISVIIAMYSYMSVPQFIFMLITMPIAMTITEAKSPHTWDNPFLHLIGGLITVVGCHFF